MSEPVKGDTFRDPGNEKSRLVSDPIGRQIHSFPKPGVITGARTLRKSPTFLPLAAQSPLAALRHRGAISKSRRRLLEGCNPIAPSSFASTTVTTILS